jgi:hypothetical protein
MTYGCDCAVTTAFLVIQTGLGLVSIVGWLIATASAKRANARYRQQIDRLQACESELVEADFSAWERYMSRWEPDTWRAWMDAQERVRKCT